ncbi:hypothetical protein [Rariglobus hedericola]|uniref:Uncharacterized protein n=1 Tax=Rariglobus hedericola TaxID=2597822 RepID=A0A556QQ78_9BACT|nr:hypothetical protein [Rariglobus hedericola]TSJ78762.1 hypothetical protein FPL22_05490 [Rariglobus hedericola]
MDQPELEKDRPSRPASENLIVQVIDIMPVRVVCAVVFVSFFFVWGGVNNVIKFFGRDIASLETNYGVIAGAVAAVVVPVVIVCVKRRGR